MCCRMQVNLKITFSKIFLPDNKMKSLRLLPDRNQTTIMNPVSFAELDLNKILT